MRRLSLYIMMAVCLFGGSNVFALGLNDHLLLGADMHYRGELERAASAFGRALDSVPDNEYALNQLGVIKAKLGDHDQAVYFFDRVITLSPDNTYARIMRGLMYLQADEPDKARALFNEVLKIDPENANALYFLGVIRYVDHDYKGAVSYFREATEAGSDDPEVHFRLGTAYRSLGMAANAELELQRVLQLNPFHGKALNSLGWIYVTTGRKSLGMDAWEQALRINPADTEVRNSLTRVLVEDGRQAMEAGNTAEAERFFRSVLQLNRRDKAANYYLRKLTAAGN